MTIPSSSEPIVDRYGYVTIAWRMFFGSHATAARPVPRDQIAETGSQLVTRTWFRFFAAIPGALPQIPQAQQPLTAQGGLVTGPWLRFFEGLP